MENNANIHNEGNNNRNRKKLAGMIVLALVFVVVAVIVICSLAGRRSGGADVVEGAAYDYEAEGYITLGDYKNISLSVEVSDEDVESEITDILSEEEPQKVEGTAASGDTVNIDYKASLNGNPVEDENAEDVEIQLGEEEYFKEFDTEIAGMKTGETKTIDVAVPDDYGYDEIDGKTVQYEVTLNYICGDMVKPELTDEFVTDYSEGECTSAADFNEYIRSQLYETNVAAVNEDVWAEVIENTTVDKYHEGELNKAIEETEKSYDSFSEMSGYSSREELLEQFDMTEDDVKDVAKDMALDKMTAKTIAAKEGLVMDDASYKEKLIEYMEYEDDADKNKSLEEIEQDYTETYSESPRDGIFLEYVKGYVAGLADITGME